MHLFNQFKTCVLMGWYIIYWLNKKQNIKTTQTYSWFLWYPLFMCGMCMRVYMSMGAHALGAYSWCWQISPVTLPPYSTRHSLLKSACLRIQSLHTEAKIAGRPSRVLYIYVGDKCFKWLKAHHCQCQRKAWWKDAESRNQMPSSGILMDIRHVSGTDIHVSKTHIYIN